MRIVSCSTLPVLAVALGLASAAYASDSAGQYVDDAAITTKIKAAIATDKVLKNTSINVTTNNGTVNLAGSVRSKDQEAEVVKIVNQTNGVRSVNDSVQVQLTTED